MGVVRDITALDGLEVEAGIQDPEMSERALRHEYGQGVPLRPFLRDTASEHRKEWGRELHNLVRAEVRDRGDAAASMRRVGESMVDDIVDTVERGDFHPLEAATVKRKGTARPLEESGEMLEALTVRVSR